jgi:hypothetical protein
LKRRQRPVPVIHPPENTSLEFAQTMGRLYYHNLHHHDCALKKFSYFFEFIRSHYFLKTDAPDKYFLHILAEKSGIAEAEIQELISLSQKLEKKKYITGSELVEINQKIESFYKICS